MTLRKRFIPFALAALLAAPSLALAADAAKVAEFIEVTKVQQNFEQMQKMMGEAMDQGFETEAQRRGMQGEALEKARKGMEVVKRGMLESLSWDAFEPEVTALYQAQLTDAELDAAIRYYRSPEGASMLAKQPALMQAAMQIGQRRTQEIMPKVQAELNALFADTTAPQPAAPPEG